MSDLLTLSTLPAALQAIRFSKKLVEKGLTSTVFGQLEGAVRMDNGVKQVPAAAIYAQEVDFDEMSYKVVQPFIGALTGDYVRGNQTLEGTEESVPARNLTFWYQREAKAIPGANEWTVDGRIETEFYKLVSRSEKSLSNYFAIIDDFNAHRALIEGYSLALTDPAGWVKSSITDIPVVALHPNWFVYKASDGGSFVTWNNTYSTYENAIQTAHDATSGTTDIFGGTAVERIVYLAKKFLNPITGDGSSKLNGAKYVCLITPQQLFQLHTEDGLFFKRFSNGAVSADVNFNISGVIGVYQEVLFITDSRMPTWNLAGSASNYISYSKPSTQGNTALSTGELTRSAHSGSGVGTMELAIILGDGALTKLMANTSGNMTGGMRIENKAFDYNTLKGMCALRMIGVNRNDAKSGSLQPINESSIIFATPSNSSI